LKVCSGKDDGKTVQINSNPNPSDDFVGPDRTNANKFTQRSDNEYSTPPDEPSASEKAPAVAVSAQ